MNAKEKIKERLKELNIEVKQKIKVKEKDLKTEKDWGEVYKRMARDLGYVE